MSTVSHLLDTPRRTSVQSQLHHARAALKDFERAFAAGNDGRKPSKDDIKTDPGIAAKYKEYNKLRDVLEGKLDYAVLLAAAPPKSSPVKRTRREMTTTTTTTRRRHDSGVGGTPQKKHSGDTTTVRSCRPRRSGDHGNVIPANGDGDGNSDDNDEDYSDSPRPLILHAIGPTPQRDGKVLGLFDLLSNSAHTSRTTTMSSGKKRKIDDLLQDDSIDTAHALLSQTPSRRTAVRREGGDLLEFLAATPAKTPETGRRKRSRTPVSDGRRFMLSQFFATPSTVRYSHADTRLPDEQTPLRDRVLGSTPDTKASCLQAAADVTPAYLRRSISFKDRLLSASQTTLFDKLDETDLPPTRTGPPTLRHFRSVPKMFKIAETETEPDGIEEEEDNDGEDDDHDDDMEALREMENGEINRLDRGGRQNSPSENKIRDEDILQRTWKKKGQKRTTRRTRMRPARGPIAQAPTFVLAGNDESAAEEEEEEEGESTMRRRGHGNDTELVAQQEKDDDEDDDDDENETGYSTLSDQSDFDAGSEEMATKKRKKKKKANETGAKEGQIVRKKEKGGKKTTTTKTTTKTINPNAVSHMNFRSLKIKNKNSKANGRAGSGRGGRGRRR